MKETVGGDGQKKEKWETLTITDPFKCKRKNRENETWKKFSKKAKREKN